MNQASHYVDLLEWLFGPIESVSAYIATISRDIESEDTAVLNLNGKWYSWINGSYNDHLSQKYRGFYYCNWG